MVSLGLQPYPDDEPNGRSFLTFVVPAVDGCNLKCAFCLINQLEEIAEAPLRPHDYARFVREASERYPIFAVGIQGYEPLLPEALLARSLFLAAGKNSSVGTTLVTNGVFLSDAGWDHHQPSVNREGFRLDPELLARAMRPRCADLGRDGRFAYMAISGKRAAAWNPAKAMIEFALDAIGAVNTISNRTGYPLKIRVGVHFKFEDSGATALKGHMSENIPTYFLSQALMNERCATSRYPTIAAGK